MDVFDAIAAELEATYPAIWAKVRETQRAIGHPCEWCDEKWILRRRRFCSADCREHSREGRRHRKR